MNDLDIERPFKIIAGPGAGKTYWLVEHIKKTIRESKRLSSPRKIACITYTNTAAEEINTRLDNCQNYVEVYTIHSFLYTYFIKPFLHLIKEIEPQLDITKVTGHDQYPYYYHIIKKWLEASGQKYLIKNINDFNGKLDGVAWDFNNNPYTLKPKRTIKADKMSIKNNSYIQLRHLFWAEGKLFHDDVLYFSAILIEKFPQVLTVIRAKFPYIFIDEFQDTTPIQSKIIKSIGEEETIIGVIGDPAQSIYEFTGASPDELNNFCLQDMQKHTLEMNHRSSPEIIKLLNYIRSDITQKSNNSSGEQPTILIGPPQQAWQYVKQECGEDNVWILGYKQETAMSAKLGSQQKTQDIFPLSKKDSNLKRATVIAFVINAIEYARQKNFKRSFKELEKVKKEKQLDIQKQLDLLSQMITSYDEISKQVMTDFHNTRIQPIFSTAKITSGEIKDFYDSFTYVEYITRMKLEDTKEIFRTIHSTKGAEREAILVIIPDEKNSLDILFNPDLENKESHRVYYVAMSRAQKRLFINISRELTEEERHKITKLGLIIKDLNIK